MSSPEQTPPKPPERPTPKPPDESPPKPPDESTPKRPEPTPKPLGESTPKPLGESTPKTPAKSTQKTSVSTPKTPEGATPKTPKEGRESVKAMKARMKREMEESPQPSTSTASSFSSFTVVPDPYANATASNYFIRGETGVTFDNQNIHHRCEWDDRHPECPDRITSIMEKLYDRELITRCTHVENHLRTDLYDLIMLVHTQKHYDKLKSLSTSPPEDFETEASKYDSVYFNKSTFDVACRSLSSVINLVEAVARRDVHNGMAIVRPPGHHAMSEEFNGYCFLNNVAIAAEMCIKNDLAKRILIVDFDVHHGQGTQRMFYERADVLYFSIHRYEHGTFWPHLVESNFNSIGKGDGLGYNINVPLNATGLTDDDYLAIVFNILLPVGYEFNPDLVIVSAGYDACLGCPEGRMKVTPGFYAHLITLLSGLARGQIAVALEGGYFRPSLAEGVVLTLKALLGGPCPILDPLRSVHPTVVDSICNVRRTLMSYWNCFRICEIYTPGEGEVVPDDVHNYQISYLGAPLEPPYPTRQCYPENSIPENYYNGRTIKAMRERYQGSVKLPTFMVYDETMLKHTPKEGEVERPERPERLTTIMDTFREFGVNNRVIQIPITRHDYSAYSVHSPEYLATVGARMVVQTKDVFSNDHTADAVNFAVSGVMCLIEQIMSGLARSGVAVVRPPGHHAEYDKPMGFCFVNNVAVAANYLDKKFNQTRILIIDFDVHHGNGTQNAFYHSKNVMYISIHRDDNGKFFPPGSPRNYSYDGHGEGQGFNINIPFNNDKMGDTEYLAVFHNIILPIAYSYGPQIILVSAGFDAGINDPLGNYNVSPETFGHFIQMLKPLAEGRIILVLEGGYNVTTTSLSMTLCVKALLGDPLFMPRNLYEKFSSSAITTIRNVIDHFKQYYDILRVNKKLGHLPILYKKIERFTEETYGEENYKILDVTRFHDSEYVESEILAFNAAHH